MKKKFILLFSLYSFFTFAQNSEYKNIVTISSVAPIIGRLDAGYIHQMNERIWIGAEFGYGNGFGGFKNNLGSAKSTIFKFSPEIYYDLNINSSWLHLLSVQYFYSKRTIKNFEDDVFANSSYYTFTSADVDRTRQGVNINYSFLINRDGKKFAIMPKFGLGVRYRDNKYSNFVGLEEAFPNVDDDPFGVENNSAGSNIDLNVNFDIKLIYRF